MRIQGHQDPPLNDEGLRQAKEVAQRLRSHPFDAIYSSDLRRAVQTAEAVAACRDQPLQVRTSPLLRERCLGRLEGRTLPELAAAEPAALALLREARDEVAAPGGGESPRQLRERVVGELELLAAAHPGQKVLVVAHGGVLHAVYKHTFGHAFGGAFGNTSILHLVVQGAAWAAVEWDTPSAAKRPSDRQFGGGVAEG